MPEIFYQLKLSLQNSLTNLYENQIIIYTIMNVCLQNVIIYYTLTALEFLKNMEEQTLVCS